MSSLWMKTVFMVLIAGLLIDMLAGSDHRTATNILCNAAMLTMSYKSEAMNDG